MYESGASRTPRSFEFDETSIFFAEGHESEALAIAQMLPVTANVLPTERELTDTKIRIVIGKDLSSLEMTRNLSSVPVQRDVI